MAQSPNIEGIVIKEVEWYQESHYLISHSFIVMTTDSNKVFTLEKDRTGILLTLTDAEWGKLRFKANGHKTIDT